MRDDHQDTRSDFWENIYTRLEMCKAHLAKDYRQSTEEKNAILRARAKQLAEPLEKLCVDGAYLTVVEFLLADEKYALELDHLREVHPIKYLTPLPCTPAFVVGIINLRGQILSIIDLKKFYNLPDKRKNISHQTIILHCTQMEFGILADAILGITSIPINMIHTSLSSLAHIKTDHVKGVTKDNVILLDGEKILHDKQFIIE
ncbi:MAG: chemotaxis protein CheW [bacterium]